MSALDKLNNKAKNPVQKPVPKKQPPKEKANAEPAKPKAEEPKEEVVVKTIQNSRPAKSEVSEPKITVEPTPAKQTPGKHPGGRTNTRGIKNKDYKMINISLPIDVYEKLKEQSPGGNMTRYITDILSRNI